MIMLKEKLAKLSMCYCISLMQYNGQEYCICASEEKDGDIVLINTENKQVMNIKGLSGGVMAIIPVPETNGGFFAIQKFYPVFDSVNAEIVYCQLEGDAEEEICLSVTRVAKLPYVHRIALTGKDGERKIIAATLCTEKKTTDDWSSPGAVYEFTLDQQMKVTEKRTLLEGIHKNHGMYTYQKSGGFYLMISGEEGVWAIDQQGAAQKLLNEPISDLCMFDVDNDGMDELICISPFHGNAMKIIKFSEMGCEVIDEKPLSFGHAVWSGLCGRKCAILSCSRGGDKCTKIYTPSETDPGCLEEIDVEEGAGASNIAVKEEKNGIVLYAANHENNEVARYYIEL